jgi:hypothetical protein
LVALLAVPSFFNLVKQLFPPSTAASARLPPAASLLASAETCWRFAPQIRFLPIAGASLNRTSPALATG